MDRKGFLYYSAPWLHLLFLAGTTFFCMILFSAVSMFLAPFIFDISFAEMMEDLGSFSAGSNMRVMSFLQLVQSIGMFIVPALIYFRVSGLRNGEYLLKGEKQIFLFILMALALGFVYSPVIDLSYKLNQLMDLPPFLDGLEQWMRTSEDTLERLTKAFLQMEGWGDFLFNMIMIALIPAIGEELMFRGALQKILADWTGNIHWAIFITAFLFSCIHMQFFGFLPRFLIGFLLGYLFYWSGNIWVPIAAHFLNNGMIVLFNFLFQRGTIDFDPWEEQDFTTVQYILSAVLTIVLLTGCYLLAQRNSVNKLDEQ